MYDAQHLIDYLDGREIPFEVSHHSRTVTAMETAAAEHVSGKCFAKSVVVQSKSGPILAVLPAHLDVDIGKLEELAKKGALRLAEEGEFAAVFPGCETGAMPPFGHVYGVDVFIDDDIAVSPSVTFNACSHEHTMTITGKDFLRAAEGVVGDFSRER